MAVKKSSRKQATPMRRGTSNGSGWLTGLLVGLLIGGLAVFYLLAIQPNTQTTLPTSESATPKQTDIDKKKSGPRFDFYKLLPENAANHHPSVAASPIPSTTTTPAPPSAFDSDADVTPTPEATTTTTGIPIETHPATIDSKLPGNYLLQAGSFRSASDADKVRANIILLGLPARVESIKNDKGETFYRIYVGSFNTVDAMKNAQTILSNNKINAVVVKSK